MIKKTIIRGIGILFFFCIICTTVSLPVHAVELVLPVGGTINGLTYDAPASLTVQQPGNTPDGPLPPLQVNNTPQFSIKIISKSDSLTDIILSPTPTEEAPSALSESSGQASSVQATPTPSVNSGQAPESVNSEQVTVTPTPTPSSSSGLTPTPQAQLSEGGGLNADVLFNMVNSYRASINLPAFQKNDQVCQIAEIRAPEVGQEVASGTMHQGLKALNLPYWNTENIISMNSEAAAFNWWIHDEIHKEAIEGKFTYSCLACSGNSCAEEFTNLQSK